MKGKSLLSLLFVLYLVAGYPGFCTADEPNALTVKKISFIRDKGGKERISIICNRACTPELSAMQGEKPRVIVDMKEVSPSQTKARNIETRGKWVKRVRSYLDKQTKILRVVLDLEPSGHFIVHPIQDGNRYMLTISEAASSAVQMPGGNKVAGGSSPSQEMNITILRPDPGTGQGSRLPEAASRSKKHGTAKTVEDVPSVDLGRSQLNAGDFGAAADTFTRILTAHPKDSVSYRLRGNAYDNLAERQKAVEDWTQAARLGDTAMQSYLEFLQIKWQGKPAP